MDKNQLKTTASAVAARVNALGFTKSGLPMVIDQAYEVVAAAHGMRNQHVLRKSLKSASSLKMPQTPAAPSSSEATNTWHKLVREQCWNDTSIAIMMEDFLRETGQWTDFVQDAKDRVEPTPELAELIDALQEPLDKKGYTIEHTDGAWSWSWLDIEASCDFPSESEAWEDLISTICVRADLDPTELSQRPVHEQVVLICHSAPANEDESAILELQKRWGGEHGFYNLPQFLQYQAATEGREFLSYWQWVLKSIKEAGGEEGHCSCGAPLNDGKCGTCADRAQ